MRRILVAGGFDDNDPRRAEIERFCKALGEAIAIQGHTYLNGCQTWFDGLVAKAWEVRASKIVALAERLASSNTVCVVMSYSGRADLEDAYESFQAVCDGFKYKCERVDNTNTVDRIVPRIHEKIEQAAFVIVDVSELRTNVFYELGFAQGLRKPIIITAKVGTELPFDVKDLPTIFWEGQKKLKEDLRAKIVLIAETQGR
jgi:nucleoside 2-deoxyribosyltransferase